MKYVKTDGRAWYKQVVSGFFIFVKAMIDLFIALFIVCIMLHPCIFFLFCLFVIAYFGFTVYEWSKE